MRRAKGATLQKIMKATGWQASLSQDLPCKYTGGAAGVAATAV